MYFSTFYLYFVKKHLQHLILCEPTERVLWHFPRPRDVIYIFREEMFSVYGNLWFIAVVTLVAIQSVKLIFL